MGVTALQCALRLSQEFLCLNPRLFEDGVQGALWHIPGMVGNGGVMVGSGVKPDLVRAGESAHQLPTMSG